MQGQSGISLLWQPLKQDEEGYLSRVYPGQTHPLTHIYSRKGTWNLLAPLPCRQSSFSQGLRLLPPYRRGRLLWTDLVAYSELSSTSFCFFFFFFLVPVSLVCEEVGEVRKASKRNPPTAHFRRNSPTPDAVQAPHGHNPPSPPYKRSSTLTECQHHARHHPPTGAHYRTPEHKGGLAGTYTPSWLLTPSLPHCRSNPTSLTCPISHHPQPVQFTNAPI